MSAMNSPASSAGGVEMGSSTLALTARRFATHRARSHSRAGRASGLDSTCGFVQTNAGSIQATGRDAKGRKQYRYHAAWRAHRDETKFDRLQAFADVLPLIRRRTNADLEQAGLPRNKVLATIVQLLEKSLIRVGNEEYARHNQSFGLTTLRSRHVRVNGGTLRFQFRGKSGVRHSVSVNDRRLARVVKQCRDLPGQELFQYLDEAGEAQVVDSGDINGYLKEITGQDFTAKDFRTWSGTVLAATALREVPPPGTKRETERNVNVAIEAVAGLLGNTPTVCRKSYVHPGVVDAYRDRTMAAVSGRKRAPARIAGLRADEVALLALSNISRTEILRGRRLN